MKEILSEHKKRYPGMEVQDVVKLLYQSEFGNGHMITEPDQVMNQLEKEYHGVQKHPGAAATPGPAIEHIGGDYCRVYLNQLPEGLSLMTLNRLFVLSTKMARGNQTAFEEKLNRFRRWTREGITGFSEAEVEPYLTEYQHQGCPVVSHSVNYRNLYQPAYRVLAEAYAGHLDMFADIDRMLAAGEDEAVPGKRCLSSGAYSIRCPHNAVLVAIDGQCASGKTTLAALVQQVYDCNVFHMDDFFLTPQLRTPDRLAEVGGNVDYERFRQQVLEPLQRGADIRYQVYDCSQQKLTTWAEAPAKRLNLIEGAYSCHPYFGPCYHLTYCLTIEAEEQQRRILKRNGEAMLKRFVEEWIPKENAYLEQFGIREE